ncbi:hypothetical protein GDO81_003355 [Engystomops pustulosus]|uniref:Uncharacterized protein n=1 Tax=Engystomops pustulosus TaxID=76066 RepID=A0AAV6ZWA5_ENGPU|nr:hypothetical protein GDO81_003355 [Engystomops pustulosus]
MCGAVSQRERDNFKIMLMSLRGFSLPFYDLALFHYLTHSPASFSRCVKKLFCDILWRDFFFVRSIIIEFGKSLVSVLMFNDSLT